MSDSPIFDQLVQSRVPMDKTYDQWVKFEVPEFEWDPSRSVVQLDKPKTGVNFARPIPFHNLALAAIASGEGFSDGHPMSIAPGIINDRPELLTERKEIQGETANFGRLIQDYVSQVGQSFAENHPLAVVTDMHTETNEDGSATVVIEAVQPITSVQPLSERNTAQPME